ncbi:AAA family ATPase [Bacillus sp. DNRA2]|uniref:AAA domain-containing protein n=1 Tax=Bacillus sp. DNRA2 TaxID=2723053 RepID=UPI00145ECF04|nr:AAA domain-containing protein [Bacillus sp. DNRA2]NMD72281.1 AAA family ATPase [Bacillus sp. DNRA2]
MNPDDNLILVKHVDKTEEIDSCQYENRNWQIRYKNNSKVYFYNFQNVKWHKSGKVLNHETYIIYENNLPITGVVKILDFGEFVKVTFKTGYKKVYERSSLVIEETCLKNGNAKNTFDYLKTLANIVSTRLDDDISFLGKQYNKLVTVSTSSVLSAYLEGKPLNKQNTKTPPIFPFGFNISQKSATEKALTEQISVIEGPPGTGKTQTILNIIANAIYNDKTVAVVSNNNSATANVLEKLQKYGVDFIAAYLGNNENKEKFFAEQSGIFPEMKEWTLLGDEFQNAKSELVVSQIKLNEMLGYQNKRAILKQELSDLKVEYDYFKQYFYESNFQSLNFRAFSRYSSEKLLKILLEYEQNLIKGQITFKDKVYNLLIHGIFNFKIYKYPPEVVVAFLQKTYYERKIHEINKQIETLSTKLENYNFEQEMKQYSQRSMALLKAKLASKYKCAENRTVFTVDALWNNFSKFIKEYPVILSTTHSLQNSAEKNYLFDFVIIDEASQVDIVTGALALSCAKNAVIVGDMKQLPNVVTKETAQIARNLFESTNLYSAFNYADHSILSSLLSVYKNIPKTLLKEHYRCHPKIIGFCNQKFYHNELIVLTTECETDQPLLLYKTAKGNHARGKMNQRQIDVVFQEIIPEQNIDVRRQSVGIITPYRLQSNELQKTIGEMTIEADTVHKYQGREREIIILTTVSNEIGVNDFADNPNLINVAVSRAVDKLIVVVSEGSEEWKGTNVGDLVRYIQYHNFEVIESQIYSVFDLLYKSYSNKLLETLKSSKRVSEFKSENLMNAVIEKVLNMPEFHSLDWVLHQPLRMLIKDPSKLNGDERKYAMNILTHTDFVIFNKLDKMPVLVVEVDGHAFHANNPIQLSRDQMKDDILRKYNIPIIRMKTTESREEDRLRQKLLELLHLDTCKEEMGSEVVTARL